MKNAIVPWGSQSLMSHLTATSPCFSMKESTPVMGSSSSLTTTGSRSRLRRLSILYAERTVTSTSSLGMGCVRSAAHW